MAKSLSPDSSNNVVSLDEFARDIPYWYGEYTRSKYFKGDQQLRARIQLKVKQNGCLESEDLAAIAVWGGNQHGIKQRLEEHNTEDDVRAITGKAFRNLGKPEKAIAVILELNHWGLTYGSKTLMFMNPQEYVALDQRIRASLKQVLPSIRDGDRASMVRGYVKFLGICQNLKSAVKEPRPVLKGEWLLADVQAAVFQFSLPREPGVFSAAK